TSASTNSTVAWQRTVSTWWHNTAIGRRRPVRPRARRLLLSVADKGGTASLAIPRCRDDLSTRRRRMPPRMTRFRPAAATRLCLTLVFAAATLSGQSSTGSKYLFVWAGDSERRLTDFLAVLDADPASKAYGHIVAAVPADAVGTMPRHTEQEFPADGMLLA